MEPHVDEAAVGPRVRSLELTRDEADVRAETLPHRAKYLHLNHRLSRRILLAYEEWLRDVEGELTD